MKTVTQLNTVIIQLLAKSCQRTHKEKKVNPEVKYDVYLKACLHYLVTQLHLCTWTTAIQQAQTMPAALAVNNIPASQDSISPSSMSNNQETSLTNTHCSSNCQTNQGSKCRHTCRHKHPHPVPNHTLLTVCAEIVVSQASSGN